MAIFSAAIYLFCFLAIAGPTAEAASLRAQAPGRSDSAPANSNASPADVEEEEEVLDEGSGDQAPPQALPAFEPLPPQPQASAVELMQRTVSSDQSAPMAIPQWSPAAMPAAEALARPPLAAVVVPKPPHTNSEALFKFTQEPKPPPSAAAVLPKVNKMSKVPMWIAKKEASLQSRPANWPPHDDTYTKCDPPCIQGRGICNDRVCFCRSPFTGSTCQHRISALYRASKVMAVGFAIMCFFLGIVLSKLVMTFFEAAAETRMQKFGGSTRRYETWMPPESDGSKKKTGG